MKIRVSDILRETTMKIYGIDLGTTYSLIGYGNALISGLVSSSVDIINKQQCERDRVGKGIIAGYKVNMTTGETGALSVKCSTIVLQKLAQIVKEKTGEEVTDVVISVPAKFSHTQRLAVLEAGENAGLNVRAIINEPTAAAVHACLGKPGLYLVYDLGGGTFDVSLVLVDSCGVRVIATDGIGNLAGNNFDAAVLDRALTKYKVPIRYRTAEARQAALVQIQAAKEQFQKDFIPKNIDLSGFNVDEKFVLDESEYLKALEVFTPTIELCKFVLTSIAGIEDPEILFVGGSSACPYLKNWVCKELGLPMMKYDLQPDLIVAMGVSEYANLLENGNRMIIQDVTKQLVIADNKGISIPIIAQDTPIPAEESQLLCNEEECSILRIPMYQGTEIIAEKNTYIGTLMFDYGRVVKPGEGLVDVSIKVNYDGIVCLSGTDISTGAYQDITLTVR